MAMAAVRVPDATGVNVALMVQWAAAATDGPQLLVTAKSAAFVPDRTMLTIVSAVFPLFVRVTL